MTADRKITSFGNFFRWQLDKHRGPSAFARKNAIALGTIERYCRADESADLHIRPYNAESLAKALGFADWAALDAAWRNTPLPPYPMKGTRGGESQVFISFDTKDANEFVDRVKSGPPEQYKSLLAQLGVIEPRGVLSVEQLQGLAEAFDLVTYDQVSKAVRQQLVISAKQNDVAGKISGLAPSKPARSTPPKANAARTPPDSRPGLPPPPSRAALESHKKGRKETGA